MFQTNSTSDATFSIFDVFPGQPLERQTQRHLNLPGATDGFVGDAEAAQAGADVQIPEKLLLQGWWSRAFLRRGNPEN